MDDFVIQPHWYLIQCKPREDERALSHLDRQGFECYRPLFEEERPGRKQTRKAALFPGYLFIRLDRVNDNWLPICSTRGVARIVRFNGYPLPVPDKIIDEIRQRVEGGEMRELRFKPGEHVLITEGSFSGLEAIFLATDGAERVVLLLNILQSDQKLSFPVESVRKL